MAVGGHQRETIPFWCSPPRCGQAVVCENTQCFSAGTLQTSREIKSHIASPVPLQPPKPPKHDTWRALMEEMSSVSCKGACVLLSSFSSCLLACLLWMEGPDARRRAPCPARVRCV